MRHRSSTSLACSSGLAFAVVLWAPGAFAADICSITGNTVVCETSGTQDIEVPDGAYQADIAVIGGGGGSGRGYGDDETDGYRPSGYGGNGAKVSATIDLTGIANLGVKVGSGGGGGTSTGDGGRGGRYSGIRLDGTVVIVAGGGGGGGIAARAAERATDPPDESSSGGSGAASGGASGGDGSDVYRADNPVGGGGGAPGDGSGGSVGTCTAPCGDDGGDWDASGADWPSDGRASINGGAGGGGGGYGGGGAGGSYGIGGFISLNYGGGGGGAGGSYADNTRASAIVFEALGVTAGTDTAGAGGASQTSTSVANGNPGSAGSVTVIFYIRNTPTNPSTSTGTASAVTLAFDLPDGVRCDFGSVEASIGSWIELPAASDCSVTPRAGDTSEDSTLLGWATSADFPVEIAQRQVDNGWGAYETYNDDGQLTGVFIPAGGFTQISGPTNLFPIMK